MNFSIQKASLVLVICLFAVSCIKDPLAEDVADTATTPEEIQAALSEGWGQADPLTMEPNDFLFQETEQTIENDKNPFFVHQEGITISKKEETATQFLYTFLYQSKTVKQGVEGSLSTREDHRTVTKQAAAASFIKPDLAAQNLKTFADDYQMVLGFERLYGLAYACTKSDSLDKYCKEQLKVDSCEIQCFNLKVTTGTMPVPPLVKEQPNCGGYKDCLWQTKNISFDWTISLKSATSTEKQRVNYSLTLSPDLPFFSRMTDYCFRQLFTIQNQKVLVNTCTRLRNFKKAQSPLPASSVAIQSKAQ